MSIAIKSAETQLSSATDDKTDPTAAVLKDWSEISIQPLKHRLLDVQPFDVTLLPWTLREWIQDTAERMDNAPIDYAAAASMTVLSSLVGRRAQIQPKRHDDWYVTPNLWGAAVGRPAARKTPLLAEMLRPLKALEEQAAVAYEREKTEYKVRQKMQQLEAGSAERKAKNLVNQGKHQEAQALLVKAQDANSGPPLRKRFTVNDATVEKLHELHSQNPGGLLVYRDELVGLLSSLQREDKQTDRAFFLEAWNGNINHISDRIGRGTIELRHAAISVLGGIQPAKLERYLKSMRSGIDDDGLIQRLQLLVYPDLISRQPVDRKPNVMARDEAREVFQSLDTLPVKENPPVYRLSEAGQRVFDAWYADHLEQCACQEDPHFEAHLSKYASLLPSITLLIHLAELEQARDIDANIVQRAVGWCDYLESHARRVYALGQDPFIGARQLLKNLSRLPQPFRVADFNNRRWQSLNNAKDIQRALNALVSHGYLQRQVIPTATKPATYYHIHPEFLNEPPQSLRQLNP